VSAVAPASFGQAPQPADATGLLYERYSGRIFGYCLSLLGSREDAEDAVQTTFVNAQRGLHRGVVPQFELAWLFRIARNVCYNARKSSSRRGRLETPRDLDDLQDVLATPERAGGVSVGDLSRALSAVPERQRRALLLREFQGLSYDEIAAELAVSVTAVETLLFRARRSVAAQLEQGGTTRPSGLVASLATFIRWLFGGGAVPLKIAAATATVVATATVAVAPLLSRHEPSPAPVSHQVRATHVEPRTGSSTAGRVRQVPVRHPSVRPPVTRTSTHGVARSTVTAASSVARESPPRSIEPPAGTDSSDGNPVLPAVEVPDVTVPSIPAPPTLTVPELSLPTVNLPSVDLSTELPAPPDLLNP
jgi:RNA polymerase sigma-70 factor (ECF subfamily)